MSLIGSIKKFKKVISWFIKVYCAHYMIVFAQNQPNWYRPPVNNHMDENNTDITTISSFNSSTTNNSINALKVGYSRFCACAIGLL